MLKIQQQQPNSHKLLNCSFKEKLINLVLHALILQHKINWIHGTFLYALTFGENLMDYGNYKESSQGYHCLESFLKKLK